MPVPQILAFTAGVLGVCTLPSLPEFSAQAALAAPAFLPWRGRALWAAFALGVLLVTVRGQSQLDERWPAERHNTDVEVEGRVANLPERDGQDWRFLFETADPNVPPRIRASWYRTGESLRANECWRFALRLRTPHGSLNPGGSDYEGWLFRQRIGATATVRDAKRCVPAKADPVLEWRQHIADAIRAALPDRPAAGMLVALTVGDESAIASADWDLFRLTGTSHLVAISGFNIAIVAGVAYFLGRWLWALSPRLCLTLPAQRAALLGAAVFAWLYALLAGFESPVQRAVLMLWIGLAAIWTHRIARAGRVLAIAWLAVLLLDPFAVLSPGLWLSFGAVAAIFYVSLGRLRPPGWWHGAVHLQWLISLALAPLSLYFFHGSSWVAPFVNLLAVPFFTVLTPVVLAAALLMVSLPALGQPLLVASAWMVQGFHAALEQITQLPQLWVPASPPVGALLLALLGVLLVFAPRGLPLRPLGALCFVPLLVPRIVAPHGAFELNVLDVGQGLAVVVRTAQHTLLYDAGPAFEDGFDAGESVVAPFLLDLGVHRLDLLVLSHGDLDHRGGVPAVRRLLRVDHELGTRDHEPCRDGQRWSWDGVDFRILNGPTIGVSSNNGGCVLRVASRDFTVLLPADIEASTETRLLREHAALLAADVLVAPHHGSKTSSTAAFVQAVHPEWVVFSAGWRNRFGHPRREVAARYEAIGAREVMTGSVGAVSVWRDAVSGRVEIREFRREAAKFWNAPAGP